MGEQLDVLSGCYGAAVNLLVDAARLLNVAANCCRIKQL